MNRSIIIMLFLGLLLITSDISYCQSSSSISSGYKEYKEGGGSDSTLILLYNSHVISKEALDSARFVRLRAQLKYKFPIDFVRNAHINESIMDSYELEMAEQYSGQFDVLAHKPKGTLEAFNFFGTYYLYPVESFDDKSSLFVLAASGAFNLKKLFLFDDAQHGHKLLDTVVVDANANPKIDMSKIDGHEMIRLRETSYGTDYMDEKEVLIGVIHDTFQNLFATDLLQANNWEIKSGRTNDFDRWTARISFINPTGEGQMAIKKEVNEDLINMDKVKSFDFADGRVIKHIRSWIEIYVWDNNTHTFVLDRNLSTGGNGGN